MLIWLWTIYFPCLEYAWNTTPFSTWLTLTHLSRFILCYSSKNVTLNHSNHISSFFHIISNFFIVFLGVSIYYKFCSSLITCSSPLLYVFIVFAKTTAVEICSCLPRIHFPFLVSTMIFFLDIYLFHVQLQGNLIPTQLEYDLLWLKESVWKWHIIQLGQR